MPLPRIPASTRPFDDILAKFGVTLARTQRSSKAILACP